MFAINEVIMEIASVPIESLKHRRYLVLSLGTGSPKFQDKYDVKKASSWGTVGWLYSGGSTPLFDAFACSDSEKTEYDVLAFFRGINANGYYMRVQVSSAFRDNTSFYITQL